MSYRFIITSCLALLAIWSTAVMAGENSLGVKASTLGAGIEYERQFTDLFGLRFGLNLFQYDGDFTVDDINYDTDVNFKSVSALFDYYPLGGAFRMTGGILHNGNEVDIVATPDTAVTIGDVLYTPEMIGTLSGSVSFNTLSPYAGLGWTGGRETGEGLSVSFDLGILFQGPPDIDDYRASGLLGDTPGFQTELDKEVAKLEDELDSYQYYPVVALSLIYRF